MNIADLFVRVRGDTSDVASKLQGVRKGLNDVENASKTGHVSLGRLGNQFENFAARIIGVNPVVSKLAATLSDFAIGGTLTVGVLAGVAAVAAVYDKLTESSRKAMEVGDKLTKTYQEEARIMALGTGGKFKADIEDLTKSLEENLRAANRWSAIAKVFQGTWVAALFENRARGSIQGALQNTDAINQAGIDQLMAEIDEQDQMMVDRNRRELDALNQQIQKEKDITAEKARQQSLAIQYSELMKRTYGTLGTVGHNFSGPAIDPLQRMLEAERSGRDMASRQLSALGVPSFSLPSVGVDVGLSQKQIEDRKAMGILLDGDKQNTDELKEAIWGSAISSANLIVSALNLGGGGKGSGLGGALGATAGFAIGTAFGGPIGGAIGSTIGNVAGSLFGGLFDHAKSQEEIWQDQLNEQKKHNEWLAKNNHVLNVIASLLNAPQGYKVAAGRYEASNAMRSLHRTADAYAARGGTLPWSVAR